MELIKKAVTSVSEKLGFGIPGLDTILNKLFWIMLTFVVMTTLFQWTVGDIQFWADFFSTIIDTAVEAVPSSSEVIPPASSDIPQVGSNLAEQVGETVVM